VRNQSWVSPFEKGKKDQARTGAREKNLKNVGSKLQTGRNEKKKRFGGGRRKMGEVSGLLEEARPQIRETVKITEVSTELEYMRFSKTQLRPQGGHQGRN